ncbi:hypothetical protein R1sor_011541 [Riccia sorocarpa]|uniref:Mediator of RNA polymerase II transcription subunit 28 n=1 Tax=Riccia sorocarpa TaxID=122646 RepID=A0ABD3I4U5_9MARC
MATSRGNDWLSKKRICRGSKMSSASDVLAYVAAMDSALLPCLPARELQAADRSSHPSLHVDVERHTRDFMDAANQLQLFFLRVGHQSQPSREQVLRQQIATLEAEIAEKDKLVERHLMLVQKCQRVLAAHKANCITELQNV